ncbi:MAG: beta-ketoacyl synthase N-terminal-like domain-containing protein [Nostoc sp.]|uniref:beta-ketoacyl synthase N-terminal-like domain-containing protein n=1 Tax=Nostoc sp. TaxID=1180 RepID=UPI002FF6A772
MDNKELNNSLKGIAVIGMAGRFPEAKSIDEFWQNLSQGRESISFFTDEELLSKGVNPTLLRDPNYVKAGAWLSDIEMFDAPFFGFTPREAEIMDPQHRLFLECAWEALENAGYNPETSEEFIGVYAGSSLSTYLLNNLISNNDLLKSLSGTIITSGNDKDHIPTRVSYKLNLKGPSLNVSTACSTSLVAVHLACQGLLSYQCDIALAGAITVGVPQNIGYLHQKDGMASPDGHCRTFDAKAQGTVFGNGMGIVVLKRLEEALADGDHIYTVIKGSAINNDGSLKVGYTAPSVDGQAAVIAEAQAIAEFAPETITYIECHGTGTVMGDPIEVRALKKVFNSRTNKKGFCAIGSVKTNIGHLDRAAGVASLIKTILALKHKQIPPSLHFEQPNPEIDFANSPFYINTTLSEWKTNGTPRRAGVSSFGIGGTNAHLILEEAPVVEPSGTTRPWQLLLLSAKTSTALETATANLAVHLKQHPDLNLADVTYTQCVGRRDFDHRRILVCQDIEDAVKALSTLDPQRVFTHYQKPCNHSIVFMFPGQGAQYVEMGRELYQNESIFREQVDQCCELLKPHLGIDLRSVLYPSEEQLQEATQQLTQTAIAQPALFVLEYALAQLWMTWGVRPEAMIGHSIGEYVAACLAGVFSLEDALALIATRGQLMQQMPTGDMLAVPLPEKEVQLLLGENLSLAAINGPSLSVISGSSSAISELQNQLTTQGMDCRRLHTSHAFHSQMMNPIIELFLAQVKKINLKAPQIPFVSNVTGTWITAAEATDSSYWARHLRQTVRFAQGIAELLQQPKRILLEVGPGRTLSILAKRSQKEELATLTSLRHPQEQQSDVAFLLHTLGRLWLFGVQIDWSGFYTYEQRHRLPLPTYPFERQRYWIERQQIAPLEKQFKPSLTALELWKSLMETTQIEASDGIKDFDHQTYLENKQWLERLCTAYMNLTLRRLGAFSNPNEKYSTEKLFHQCRIIPRYRQLLCRWLDVLIEQGHLQQDEDIFTNLLPFSTNSVTALIEEVKIRTTDILQLIDQVQTCGENLAAVLIGEKEPLELFVGLKYKKSENSSPKFTLDNYYKVIMQTILQQMVRSLPEDVNLRILEVGAGQGMLTAELLPLLPSEQTNYTFTDVGVLFLDEAQQKFNAYPFVEYRLLDIEQPPQQQGYSSHSFDVVIAYNVLHVTQNMGKTLEHVRSLLAPEGFLLIWELTQPTPSFDISWGLLMNPLEDEERSRGNPFLSKEKWYQALRNHGFVEVAAFPETEALGQHILVAQASSSSVLPAASAFTATFGQKDADKTSQVSLDKKPDIANWFYIPSWKRLMPPQPYNFKVQATRTGCWLVFVDECGLGDKMVQRLALEGQDAIAVRIGEQFDRNGEYPTDRRSLSGKLREHQRSYTINPQQRDDYNALLQELRAQGKIPKTIVHLWSVTPDIHAESAIESLEKAEALGFYSLLFLAQALGENNQTDSVEIGIVSNNMQELTGSEVLCPEKALVLGPVKVIPLEYPNITCRSIDVVIPAKESRQEKQLIEVLLAELITQTSDQVIAYRGIHRWVQDFQPVRLEGASSEKSRLREQGVYLITGGLGGVGLALAEYLAQTVQAKLILLGRSPFPERDEWSKWLSTHDQHDSISFKIQKLQALEALGAKVMVVSADVANLEQMSTVLKQVNHQFGQIHGVIHAAAVYGGGMIQLTTKEAAGNALAPKVKGTRVLEALFKDTELDLFVLCSSLSSFLGTPGMMDYTAENAFFDAFAHYSASADTVTRSINWGLWNDLGMAVAVEARHQQITGEELTTGMTSEEGVEAFRRILHSSTVPQVIVSTQDFQAMIQLQESPKSLEERLVQVSRAKSTHPRPSLGNAYVAPSNEVECTLVDIWQQLFGLDKIGIHDDFFELGGDSLFSTIFVSRLRQTFELELSYQIIFNAPTVAELAEIIIQGLTEKADNQTLAQTLAEIQKLSEDEARTILASPEQFIETEDSNE